LLDLEAYLQPRRDRVLDRLRAVLANSPPRLAKLVLDYPLRPAKGLRPALCVASCAAFGGAEASAEHTAAALELFHNAALVHDDVEDGSRSRRSGPTLHEAEGLGLAVNTGDAMLAMALELLLENTRTLGLAASLRILQLFSRTVHETAIGQMIELDWIAGSQWDVSDDDYLDMVRQKTARYSFVAPVLCGAIAAGADEERAHHLERYAECAGMAFQIADDLLDLEASASRTGKDESGDLWEAKRTLPLLHALRSETDAARRRAMIRCLDKPRPRDPAQRAQHVLLEGVLARVSLSSDERACLESLAGKLDARNEADVEQLHQSILRHGGAAHARRVACALAEQSTKALEHALSGQVGDPAARLFLETIPRFVLEREH
jgi:geranylgeranyl diphosphate synthase type II